MIALDADPKSMGNLIARIVSENSGDKEQLLLDFISVVSFRAGNRLGANQSASISESYHDALREAYVALGGKPESMY